MTYNQLRKKAMKYMSQHVEYNALIHALGGISIGLLIASPLAHPHPVRWALVFGGLSILGHIYAIYPKK